MIKNIPHRSRQRQLGVIPVTQSSRCNWVLQTCQYKLNSSCLCSYREKNVCLRGNQLKIKGWNLEKKNIVSLLLTCLTGWECWEYFRGAQRCPSRRWELRWSRTSTSFYQRRWQDPGHRRWRRSMLEKENLLGIVFQFSLPWIVAFELSLSNLLSTSFRKAVKQVEFCISQSPQLRIRFQLFKSYFWLSLVCPWSEKVVSWFGPDNFSPLTNYWENWYREMWGRVWPTKTLPWEKSNVQHTTALSGGKKAKRRRIHLHTTTTRLPH